MAGASLALSVEDHHVQELLAEVIDRLGHAQPVMEVAGEIVVASIHRTFLAGGKPNTWQALSPVTLAKKDGQGSTLIGKGGMASGLMGSIHYEAEDDNVYVGTNKIYAASMHFGREGGGWGGSDIPAREFLVVQEEDWDEIMAEFIDYLNL